MTTIKELLDEKIPNFIRFMKENFNKEICDEVEKIIKLPYIYLLSFAKINLSPDKIDEFILDLSKRYDVDVDAEVKLKFKKYLQFLYDLSK